MKVISSETKSLRNRTASLPWGHSRSWECEVANCDQLWFMKFSVNKSFFSTILAEGQEIQWTRWTRVLFITLPGHNKAPTAVDVEYSSFSSYCMYVINPIQETIKSLDPLNIYCLSISTCIVSTFPLSPAACPLCQLPIKVPIGDVWCIHSCESQIRATPIMLFVKYLVTCINQQPL